MLLVLSACPKQVRAPLVRPTPNAPAVLLPLTEDQRLEKRIATLASEALALAREQDEALWAHWTAGAPLDLEQSTLKHAVLFDDATWVDVQAARAKGLGNPLGVLRLERWLWGARLARATATANGELTSLEARLTFKLAGKDVRWRDLGRLLANEKSAVKRKALWAASREVLTPLGDAYRARDEAVAGEQAPSVSVGEVEGPPLARSEALARSLLDQTDAEWKQLLEQLARSELGLPLERLAREDLPRLLRPSSAADALFPRQDQAAKAAAVLGVLGLSDVPGLTLDLTESSKKNPLPLTVAPGGPADVRVCFRPAGGVRDLGALLGELGRAIAWHEVSEPADALPALGTFLEVEASALLFARLVDSPDWLREHGVTEPDALAVLRSQRAQRLFELRRSAGNVIAWSVARGQTEEAIAETWRTWSTRALGVPVAIEDAPRWRLETDPLGRAAGQVQAWALCAQWLALLPPAWWKDAATTPLLRSAWTPASSPGPSTSVRPDAGSGVDAGQRSDR